MRLSGLRVLASLALIALASVGCGDDDETPANPGSCTVVQTGSQVTVSCPDGTSVTLPVNGDGGSTGTCNVTTASDGTVTIKCPDGSTATIPGGSTGGGGMDASVPPLGASVLYRGATSTACGSCHDAPENEIHFSTMTTIVRGIPVEGCPTCHGESGPNPVSVAHARPEFGPPGFQVEILGASIDATTRLTTVNVKLQDKSAPPKPLTRTGVSLTFTIAHVAPLTPVGSATPIAGPYVSYLVKTATQLDNPDYPLEGEARVVQQATGDSAGTFVDTGTPDDGLYAYTFKAALPADYDPNQTHVIGLYGTRTVGPVRWVSNTSHFFVPANAAAVPLKRLAVHTETCNGCHNPLSAHGGSRQEVQVCLTCHSQGSVDPETNNSIDFNVMIHKIHMGADLPHVKAGKPYGIVGYGNNTIDFSHVEYPRDLTHCQSCHSDTDDDRWVTNGTPTACMSCHENIHEPGVHPFGLTEGAVCGNGNCHGPGGSAPDARKSHATFLNNPNAPVFDISIVSAMVANADSPPQLRVRAQSGTRTSDGGVPVASVDNLSLLNVFFNGPNRDFVSNGHNIKTYNKASLVGLAPGTAPGEFTFALPQTLREAAGTMGDVSKDSYTLSIRAQYDPTPGGSSDAGVNDVVDMTLNPTVAISASGAAPVPRTAVTDTVKCNSCHGVLTGHGGNILAHNVEACIMCHTSTLETSLPQGANKEPGPTKSLRFPMLIHRIHAHAIATSDYILYTPSPTPPYPHVDFSDVAFPGDVKACATCHLDGTNFVPIKASPAPTQTLFLDAEGKPIQP